MPTRLLSQGNNHWLAAVVVADTLYTGDDCMLRQRKESMCQVKSQSSAGDASSARSAQSLSRLYMHSATATSELSRRSRQLARPLLAQGLTHRRGHAAVHREEAWATMHVAQ